jgi:hypothetical protein
MSSSLVECNRFPAPPLLLYTVVTPLQVRFAVVQSFLVSTTLSACLVTFPKIVYGHSRHRLDTFFVR